MRTIKFRGKRINRNGEWAYGDLRILPDRTLILSQGTYNAAIDRDMVDETTIGQFTGLHDREGKEIYEGDIVSMLTKRFGEEIFIIAYEDRHLGAFALCEGDVYSRFVCVFGKDYGYEPFYCEVIGNIHDNPELLKGENVCTE